MSIFIGFFIWVIGFLIVFDYHCRKGKTKITRTEVSSCLFWPILFTVHIIKWIIILIQEMVYQVINILTTKWW